MIYKQYILLIIASFFVIIGVSAMTITGTPQEIKEFQELNVQSLDTLGARNIENIITHGTLTAQGTASSTFGNSIIPDTTATYDIGGIGSVWRQAYIGSLISSGGLTLTGGIDEALTIGNGSVSSTINGSSTSTFPYGATFATTGGNVGIGTTDTKDMLTVKPTTSYDGITLLESDSSSNALTFDGGTAEGRIGLYFGGNLSHDIRGGAATVFNELGNSAMTFRIESDTNAQIFYVDAATDKIGMGTQTPDTFLTLATSTPGSILTIGGGTATTTLAAGTAGVATSTFTGDTSIENAFLGMSQTPIDSGLVDVYNVPISASSASGTANGIIFTIDGNAVLNIQGKSDSLGSSYNRWVGIGTLTPSSTLHIAPDAMSTNNTATTTVTIGSDNMSPGCLKMQDTDRLGWSYLTVINGVGTWSQTSCE